MNNPNYNQAIAELALMAEGGAVDENSAMMAQLEQMQSEVPPEVMQQMGSPEVAKELEQVQKFAGGKEEAENANQLEAQIVNLIERQIAGDTNFSPDEQKLLEAINAEIDSGDIDLSELVPDDEDEDEDEDEDVRMEDLSKADILELQEAAVGLASLGRMNDDRIAHVATGEVVLPIEMMEDPEFAQAMISRFEAMGIDPRARVVGSGIASLNDISGLEEFGLLKKVSKSVKKRVKKVAKSAKKHVKKVARTVKKVAKKVIKPIAQVAQFIPGPWQPFAALASKAWTVYDVAKGNVSPLALLSVAGPLAAGGSAGSNLSAISKAGGGAGGIGGLVKGIGAGLKGTGSVLKSGIGKLATNPSGALSSFGDVLKSANYSGQAKVPTGAIPTTGSFSSGPSSSNFFSNAPTGQMSGNIINQSANTLSAQPSWMQSIGSKISGEPVVIILAVIS